MSVASEITRINGNIAAAYTACNSKGATMPQAQNSANLANTINSISQGGGSATEKDVNFYDYDGTLLHSYTLAEAAELSALPSLPSHTGLVAQCWNYTLAQVKSLTRKAVIGCNFNTDDGSTKLYLSTRVGGRLPELRITLYLAAESSVTVDWGDGASSVMSNSAASPQAARVTHTYAVSVSNDDVCVRFIGGSFELGQATYSYSVFGEQNNTRTPINRIQIGSNCTALRQYAFFDCASLAFVTIPQTVTSIADSAFQNCFNLAAVAIPAGVTSIHNNTFQNCNSLITAAVPASVTAINSYAFYNCYGMRNIAIPAGVTNFGTAAFQNCYTLRRALIPVDVTAVSSNLYNNCYGLTEVFIPSGVTAIGNNAFNNCGRLSIVNIPDSCTDIASYAFGNCQNLSRINIPAGVTTVHSYTLYNSFNRPEIDMSAFVDPDNLPTAESTNLFYNSSPTILVANQTMLNAFSSATNWSTYANNFRIKGA